MARPVFGPTARLVGAGVAVGVAGGLAAHALAEHHEAFAREFGPGHDFVRDREFVRLHDHDFHDRDFHHFNEFERERWRAGLWYQDWHYGRWGWWYGVGEVWYPYPEPIYPYPLTVSEIVVPERTIIEAPPGARSYGGDPSAAPIPVPVSVAYVSPAGTEVVIRPLPAAPIPTYQCPPAAATYPMVRVCSVEWVATAPN